MHLFTILSALLLSFASAAPSPIALEDETPKPYSDAELAAAGISLNEGVSTNAAFPVTTNPFAWKLSCHLAVINQTSLVPTVMKPAIESACKGYSGPEAPLKRGWYSPKTKSIEGTDYKIVCKFSRLIDEQKDRE